MRQLGLAAALLMAVMISTASAAPEQASLQTAESGIGSTILFYILGSLTLTSALGVALSKSVVRMAVWLFVTLGSVAMLYFLLAANFIAAIQLIVYVGGVLILLIFGVMLTTKSPRVRFAPRMGEVVAGGVVCVLLLVAFATIIAQAEWQEQVTARSRPMAEFGRALLTTYLVPFEAASVLLLVVMIGAAYLAKQEK